MTHEAGSLSDAVAPRSRLYQGPFGRIFDGLDPWTPPGVAEAGWGAECLRIANELMIEQPGPPVTPPAEVPGSNDPDPLASSLPAAYTYFGQFVDHDITFDPTSSLQRRNDPNKLTNFRTPRLDLDCVYGRGPEDQPYLYDDPNFAPAGSFLIGTTADSNLRDLPRNVRGRALIGDLRNDENAIVCQVQLAFLLAHNKLLARATDAGQLDPFHAAQTTLRWLYQWIVWNDFLGRITDPEVHANALAAMPGAGGRTTWTRGLKDIYNWHDQPFMPVEFSVAAYRFGHSMVRNSYQTNAPHRGFDVFAPIFNNTTPPPGTSIDDLRGFRPLEKLNALQWDWYLHMDTSSGPFPQTARKIDTKLANALAFLHEGTPGSPMNVLASRNLLRGIRFELPSGTDVAKRLGLTPIALGHNEPDALWFYILKEAELGGGEHLGPVGSIIVLAVFSGLLAGDPRSYLNVAPAWTPDDDPLLTAADKRDAATEPFPQPAPDGTDPTQGWRLASIVRLAGLPINDEDVTNQS